MKSSMTPLMSMMVLIVVWQLKRAAEEQSLMSSTGRASAE